jgi:hypothetical protein
MIACPAADVTGNPRRQLTDRLRHHLPSLVPFQLSCTSPPATQSSVLLDQDGAGPVGPFTAVHTRVRQAIRDVLGDDVLAYDTVWLVDVTQHSDPVQLPVGMRGPYRPRRPAMTTTATDRAFCAVFANPDVDRVCAWPQVPGFV